MPSRGQLNLYKRGTKGTSTRVYQVGILKRCYIDKIKLKKNQQK